MPRWIDIRVESRDETADRSGSKPAGQPSVAETQEPAGEVPGGSGARFLAISTGIALLVVLAVAGFVLLRRPPGPGADLPAVVATVNGEKISREQLVQAVNINRAMYPLAQGRPLNVDPAAMRQFELQLLDQMIDNMLILQEAKKANLTVNEKDVDAEVNGLVAKYQITDQQLDAQLASVGLRRSDLREWLRGALLASQLITKKASQPTSDGQPFNVQNWLNEIQVNANIQVFLGEPASTGAAARPGTTAPDFTLKDLDGKEWTLSQLKGQPVMVNFWATWCKPCKIEMPLLEKVYQKYKDQGFIILAVDIKGDLGEAAVRQYVQELGLTFPVVMDTTGQVENTYRVRAYPTSVFVGRDGTVVDIKRGAIIGDAELERYLGKILTASVISNQESGNQGIRESGNQGVGFLIS
jgi:thiol-disulfide isomerase/thioredoxin